MDERKIAELAEYFDNADLYKEIEKSYMVEELSDGIELRYNIPASDVPVIRRLATAVAHRVRAMQNDRA